MPVHIPEMNGSAYAGVADFPHHAGLCANTPVADDLVLVGPGRGSGRN